MKYCRHIEVTLTVPEGFKCEPWIKCGRCDRPVKITHKIGPLLIKAKPKKEECEEPAEESIVKGSLKYWNLVARILERRKK